MRSNFASASTKRARFTPSVKKRMKHRIWPKLAKVQDKTIEKEVPVSLEEICKGAEKKMKISRRIHHDDGRITNEEKVLKINIKPGWKSGTKVTFNQEGDRITNEEKVLKINIKPGWKS